MQEFIEKTISLPKVSVLLANVRWATVQEFTPPVAGYYICQRLSDDHSAIKIDNLAIRDAFPRVRSVGLLPPAFSVHIPPVERPFRGLNCVFEKSVFENATGIDPQQWNEDASAFVNIGNSRLETVMQQIYTELLHPAFGTDTLIEAASTIALVELARYGRQRLGKSNTADQPFRGKLAPWQLRRIGERIEASLELGYPTLNELSQLCGISQSHLMRTFKASTGRQIHKYIAEERLKAAKRLLAEDRLSAREISEQLGFCSPTYFASAFRRMTGLTPSDFRRRARVGEVGGI